MILAISKNDIAYDHLDSEDLEFLQKLDDLAIVEVTDGDEGIQYALGEAWNIEDLKTFEPGDRLVSSYVEEAEIPFSYEKKKGYYAGESIYECRVPTNDAVVPTEGLPSIPTFLCR